MFCFYTWVIITSLTVPTVKSWNNEDLEIFDLVEEIGIKVSFYELIGVEKSAALSEIKRAFRSLSIHLHPDKNKAPEANVQFRNLVAVYDVLKDTSKRNKYDKVLRDGLPNWKSALYYYRQMRRISLTEAVLIFCLFITIAQYLFAWAACIEKKYTIEQILGNRVKKHQRKSKKNVEIEEIIKEIPTPSITNTLPFQIPAMLYNLIIHGPEYIKQCINSLMQLQKCLLNKQTEKRKEQERLEKLEIERAIIREEIKIRKRKAARNVPQKTNDEMVLYTLSAVKHEMNEEKNRHTKKLNSGGLWLDDDLVELGRLIKKYPGGILNRWEIIADIMNRSIYDVTQMAGKLKDTGYKLPEQYDTNDLHSVEPTKNKIKTRKVRENILIENYWTQEQQKALECAIIKFSKTVVGDRWQKISNNVPGKTKEECLLRYRYLVEKIKKQKQEQNVTMKQESVSETVDQTELLDNTDKKQLSCEKFDQTSHCSLGKSKNLRKARKKEFEISYDDYQ